MLKAVWPLVIATILLGLIMLVQTTSLAIVRALGPVVVLDDEYHGHMTPGKLRSLLQSVRDAEKEVAHA